MGWVGLRLSQLYHSKAYADAVSGCCVQEKQAAQARLEAEKDIARRQARLQQLQQQQAALEEARRARQEALRLELEQARLAKQVELQKAVGAVEMRAWEAEERRAAAERAAGDEEEARLRAELARQQAVRIEH
jgi:hypothetical protein